jgi:hypothetical protein
MPAPASNSTILVICSYFIVESMEAERFMRTASRSRPRTKPPEERRDELMNAAQRLFLEHGVGPTTIEQITSAA